MAGCSFWTAQLAFSGLISARQFCLLGNNRYAAPITFGVCNDHDPSTGSVCNECMAWDSTSKRECTFLKGYGPELGVPPPSAGYDDTNCPIGYEVFTAVDHLSLSCPSDTVLVLEIFATAAAAATPSLTLEANNATTTVRDQALYDFAITTSKGVYKKFEAHQCLTGSGGRGCGEDALTMLAYQQGGKCNLGFSSGVGYQVQCDNGLDETSAFFGDRQGCFSKNGYTCHEVMQLQRGSLSSSNTQNVVLNKDDDADHNDNFQSALCGLDEAQGLSNPVAWLVGAATVLLTLLPAFSNYRKGALSPAFLVGLLTEAMKNGLVMASIIAVDWSCLQQYGLIVPSGNHSIFLPYALISFSLADTILAFIAIVAKWGQDLDDTFDEFKWLVDDNNNLSRRVMTFLTIVIFGGMGGFMQLALVLEGTVDNPEESGTTALSNWASWVFIISASLGGLFGSILIMIGVYTGKMRVAWKTYKILVGDIPGLVAAVDLAAVLSVGWLGEVFADFIHIILYVPLLLAARKALSTEAETSEE